MSRTSFASLPLPPELLRNLETLGYEAMTPIQAAALPAVLAGHDLIAKAKTGSGKTAAFGIGLLLKLEVQRFQVQALVLCPTRELADQVAKELRRLARLTHNVKIITLCGGVALGPQIGSLEHGAHVVVGTPGRIQEHLRKGTLKLDAVHTFVLDEADRMLDMGFYDSIADVASHLPADRQTLLFSATYPAQIRQLSSSFQRNPQEVSVEAIHNDSQIEQIFYETGPDQRLELLLRLLNHYRPESAVIFCNTKQACEEVASGLQAAGWHALALHGDLEQRDRDQVLVQFANRSAQLLIATDVAARGLDIKELAMVVNYELSRSTDVHIHRIGRTGRAGESGLAISLCAPSEAYKVNALEDHWGTAVVWGDTNQLPQSQEALPEPAMASLCIAAGRKDKLRPGDILGALTGDAGLPANQVGKIDIFDFQAFVAVERSVAKRALQRLSSGRIKGRNFKVRLLR